MKDDLISRQAAIKTAIKAADIWDGGYNLERERIITKELEKVPTAQPKMGKWLHTDDMYETLICSVCDYDTQDYIDYPYCPNCGAKMTI